MCVASIIFAVRYCCVQITDLYCCHFRLLLVLFVFVLFLFCFCFVLFCIAVGIVCFCFGVVARVVRPRIRAATIALGSSKPTHKLNDENHQLTNQSPSGTKRTASTAKQTTQESTAKSTANTSAKQHQLSIIKSDKTHRIRTISAGLANNNKQQPQQQHCQQRSKRRVKGATATPTRRLNT